ncbi:MAG: sensor histidine kinase [Dehalococcoidales bacterium]|nr:sensor histidine kinase [Dehalococcoidales bacterium]
MKRTSLHNNEGIFLLRLIRGLALVLGCVLLFFFHEIRPFLIPNTYLVTIIAMYTVLRIYYPSYRFGKASVTRSLIAADLLFCCSLPFLSGGIISPFILLPLTVILSVGLYFRQRTTYIIAAIVSVSIVSSEIISHEFLTTESVLPDQVYLVLIAAYIIIAFLIAWLPYVSNLNLSATIKERSIAQERSRISRELHDGIAQRLSSLILKMDVFSEELPDIETGKAVDTVKELKHELQESYSETRDVINLLRTKMPETPSILPTLAQYTQEFARNMGINCQLYLSDGHYELHPLASSEILYIIQEALNNVKKHSDANKIEVGFETTAEEVKIRIKDDGQGFSPGSIQGHHGLDVMRERSEGIGGTFNISSSPGQGTVIEITIPAEDHLIGKY